MDPFERFSSDRRGDVAILFALLSIVLFGISGLAIDHIRAVKLKSSLQTSLDAAVIAGATAPLAEREGVAQRVFDSNIADELAGAITLDFTASTATRFEGRASGSVDTTLSGFVGIDKLDVNVTSAAGIASSGKLCILVRDTSASQAFLINGGADVIADECEVHVASTGSNAAVFNSGTTIESERLCIASNSILDNGGSHPNMETSCSVASDPYAGKFPEPSSSTCTYSSLNFNGGNVSLSPGVYCGGVNFNSAPNVTLAPGLYIIKNGDWNVSGGDWTGTGVTFYFADQSKLQFNSAVRADLSAPTSGPYANVIMTEKEGLGRSPFVVNDSRGFDTQGIIYLPSRDAIWNYGTSMRLVDFAIVVNTLILNQTMWRIDPELTPVASTGGTKHISLVK